MQFTHAIHTHPRAPVALLVFNSKADLFKPNVVLGDYFKVADIARNRVCLETYNDWIAMQKADEETLLLGK